jgi:hypothetical protein
VALTEETTVEAWRDGWRRGFAPLLSNDQLTALRDALAADDRRLIQGGTTTPPPLMCMRDFPVEAGCLLGYCGAVAHGGIGVATVGQVEEAFVRFCFDADNAVGEPAYCRNLLNFWDDTPRPAARVLVLEEVAYTLAGRGIGNAPDPLLAGGAGPVGVAAVGVAGESVAA